MRVAVVTPYFKESIAILKRCSDSVRAQTYGVTHVMVSDGHASSLVERMCDEHIRLPIAHDDAGATPRAIGALSAFSRGFDAVAFLDADNWYEPNHISAVVKQLEGTGADAVAATRTIHAMDGSPLYVDRIESHPDNGFIDTNCWLISRRMSRMMGFWITEPADRLVSDKVFYQACRANGMRLALSEEPTVAYVSRWAWHYQQAGVPVPDDAVWMDVDAGGNHIQIREADRR